MTESTEFRAHRSGPARFVSAYGQEIVIACALVALFVVVSAINPRFLGANNVNTIVSGNAYIAVAAIGMSMIISTGHIDVSVGALIGVLATISGTLAVSGYPVWVAWTLPILIGAAINGVVGALVAYGRLPSIVVTLGMLSILRGGLVFVTGGAWINNLPPSFQLAQARLLGVPVPIWFMLVLTIAAFLWMRNTAFGRSLYAIGGNAEAARLAGVKVRSLRLIAFSLTGLGAAVGGLMYASRVASANPTQGGGLMLDAIAAVFLGMTMSEEGEPRVLATLVGVLILGMLDNGLTQLSVDSYVREILVGTIIVAAVAFSSFSRRNG